MRLVGVTVDDALKNDLIRDEGLRLTAYKDSLGYWTIGVGHLLGASPRMSSITQEEAMALLSVDVDTAEALARRVVPGFGLLDAVRQRALVNMAFNRGEHMATSTTILPAILKACSSESASDWQAVADAINGSQWAQQVGDRASRIGQALATGKAT